MPLNDIGKVLVLVGLALTLGGLLLWSGVGRSWLGQLPGDLRYTRGNFSFNFPIVTCLILSLIITVLLWFFRRG